MNNINGKIAVVTGGTQGLGAAVALRLAEAGATRFVICGRSTANGNAVAETIGAATRANVVFQTADLSRVDDCRAVIHRADAEFGGVDILVNAAGITDRGTILDTDEALFDRMFATNTRGPFFLMQEAIKCMIRDGREGAIVNIGSTSALAGQPFISAYCASKEALATITRNTAFAVMRNRIRVNQLNIGWMASDGEDRTQRGYHNAPDNWLEKAAAEQPFGRLLAPEEVARAVNYLVSDDAGMMTGAVINFDQSVWGAYQFAPPTPAEAMTLPG
jgi:NAD(P)-dependent dehydrogenase (short-subunit alcohol dehydrogenase family)